jgi:hypothetical protein
MSSSTISTSLPVDSLPSTGGTDHFLVLYDNAHMISALETKLIILFWSQSLCIEVVCRTLGVHEDTVRIYIDYRQVYQHVVLNSDFNKLKKSRKVQILDYLLARLSLVVSDADDTVHKWKLTLKLPSKDRRPSLSNAETTANPSNNIDAELGSSMNSHNNDNDDKGEHRDVEKERKKQTEKQQDVLLKLLCDIPSNISAFDINLYFLLKR